MATFDEPHITCIKSDPDIRTLCARIDAKELLLTPTYQRKAGIWGPSRRSRLVESLIVGIPIPPIFVARHPDGTDEVVDGLQRLDTIHRFIKGAIPLSNLEFIPEFDGYRFARLPPTIQRRLTSASLTTVTVPMDTPKWGDRICNIIFERINSPVHLNSSERARGTDKTGNFRNLVDSIRDRILEITGAKEGKRQTEWDLGAAVVLGVLAQPFDGHDLVIAGLAFGKAGNDPKKSFLATAQTHLDNMSPEARATVHATTVRTLDLITQHFGESALRRTLLSKKDGVEKEHVSERCAFSAAFFQSYVVNHAWKADATTQFKNYTRSLSQAGWLFDRGAALTFMSEWHRH